MEHNKILVLVLIVFALSSFNLYQLVGALASAPVSNTNLARALDYDHKVVGTNLNYWYDYISIFQTTYGYTRMQAIDHMVDIIYAAGFNHIRHDFIATDLNDDVLTETSNRCHQLGMTFSLQALDLFSPISWGGNGSDNFGEQQIKCILNINGEGDQWRTSLVQAVQKYQTDGIDVFNEPMDWNWLSQNSGSWFNQYSSMSNESDYYNKYHAWLLNTITAVRSAKSGILIILDTMPFFDSRVWVSSYLITGSDIAYSVHDYYSFEGNYPPSYAPWYQDYWNGNLAKAKSELYSNYDTVLHGPLVNAGVRVWQEELGANWNNPNYQQYYIDSIQYNILRGCRYSIFAAHPYPRWYAGLLTSDWTQLNTYGVWITNYIKSLDTSSGANLGIIPDKWGVYDNAPSDWTAIVHLDYSVIHNGDISIRIDPHTSADTDITRECDGTWYPVKPGDHVVAKVWVKTGTSGLNPDPSLTPGGRIGVHFYGHTSAGYGILAKTASADSEAGLPGWYDDVPGAINGWWVPYGKDWMQVGWDVIIPADWYPYVSIGGTHLSCNPVQVDSFVVWLDVRSTNNPGQAWFADAELYINPATTPAPPPSVSGASAVQVGANMGVYRDAGCNEQVSSISWGTLELGGTQQVIVYVRNDGNDTFNLDLATRDWQPGNAYLWLDFSWSCQNTTIAAGQVVKVTQTLHVSSDFPGGFSGFSFNMLFEGGSYLLGDIDKDRVVGIHDLAIIAAAYGSTPGDRNWNPDADVTKDGIVNLLDLMIVAGDYGKTSTG